MTHYWQPFLAAGILVFVQLQCCAPQPSVTPTRPIEVTTEPDEAIMPASLELEERLVWHQPVNATEYELESQSTAGEGDSIRTEHVGKALLKWPDLWLRLYGDSNIQVEDVTPDGLHLALAQGNSLIGVQTSYNERVINLGSYAEIQLHGTLLMVSVHPTYDLAVVRMFDGEATVRNLSGDIQELLVQTGEWALLRPEQPPLVSEQLTEMRQLARELDWWDVYHEIELDAAGGFASEISGAIPVNTINLVFVEEPTAPFCEVTTGSLNLREGPNTEFPSIQTLEQGTRLEPLARIDDTTWLRVRVPSTGDVGWTSGKPQYVTCNFNLYDLAVETTQPPLPTIFIACEPPYSTIELGSCAMLRWTVENAQAIYFEGEPVNARDSREVCPQNSQSYALHVVTDDGDQYCTMNVDVRDSNGPEIVSITSAPDPALSSGRLPPICYEDKVLVDARVIDPSGVAKVQILFWSDSFKAESGWGLPYDMGNIGNDIYEHPSRAGNTIKIRAEDSLGNVSESAEYSIECVNVQTLYNFVSQANEAQWMTYDGNQFWSLYWPGEETDEQGFARWLNYAVLEDGSTSSTVLQTHPAWTSYGTIDGQFDLRDITIQESDYFVGKVGFPEGAYAGDITFHIGFWDGDADSHNEWIFEQTDTYDGQLRNIEFPLVSITGKTGYFTLQVEANGDSSQDWAVWTEARLERR